MAIKSSLVDSFMDEEYEFEIPTSMIDVVFLLLVFFLVASKFHQPEQKLGVNLPKEIGTHIDPNVILPTEIRLFVDGTGSGPDFTLNKISVPSTGELTRRLRHVAMAAPNAVVVIVGKHKTPFRFIVWALDACSAAEIDDVRFHGLPVPGLGKPVEGG